MSRCHRVDGRSALAARGARITSASRRIEVDAAVWTAFRRRMRVANEGGNDAAVEQLLAVWASGVRGDQQRTAKDDRSDDLQDDGSVGSRRTDQNQGTHYRSE